MDKIIFATHNKGKRKEVQSLFENSGLSSLKVLSLDDIDYHDEIIEDGDSFEANAKIKAKTIFDKLGVVTFGDDSGLVVEALKGEPGIYSARYAGTGKSEDNIRLVLKNLEGVENRKAYFVTVIGLQTEKDIVFFEGKIQGEIVAPDGTEGFGYDPIFKPLGFEKTFAQMTKEQKNKISHRAIALKKMIEYLKQN